MAAENQGSTGSHEPDRGAGFAEPERGLVPGILGRSCGTCNLCCKLLGVPELSKPAGQWCRHTAPRSGCAIHPERPATCRAFLCAWRLDPNLGPEWKPEVARFMLSEDTTRRVLTVTVDPGMPLAWKREPYYSRLKKMAEAGFRQDCKVLVGVRGQTTVVLPDRDVPLGALEPGEEIAIWREGSSYQARRQRELAGRPVAVPTHGAPSQPYGQVQEREAAPAADDPAFLDSVFRQAFEKTAELLDHPGVELQQALTWTLEGRNKVLDETAETYAAAGRAQCGSGCVSCCYVTVSSMPFEILAIARHILETKTPAEIEGLKARLLEVAQIPPDPTTRAKAAHPCALLQDGLCSVYGVRPVVCRMTLSQSRAACEACLKDAGGLIPYIDQPSKVAAAMQMGIDYALISRRNLSTEKAELSRALLIALGDYPATLSSWLSGGDPLVSARLPARRAAPNAESVSAAGRRLGLA